MRAALADAGLEPGAIDAVASARGGVPDIDGAEAAGLREVLGEDVREGAAKLIFGETFGAGGAFGCLAALAWMGGARIPEHPAGDAPKNVLVTAVGYYGNVSAVVLGAPS